MSVAKGSRPVPARGGPHASGRVRSALVGSLLALSAVLPAGARAQEVDRVQEGAAPEQPGDGEADSPGFDPGGETALPLDVPAPPVAPPWGSDDEEDGPLETEPADDPDARLFRPPEANPADPPPALDAPPVAPVEPPPPEGEPRPDAGPSLPTPEAEPPEPAALSERSVRPRVRLLTPDPPPAIGRPPAPAPQFIPPVGAAPAPVAPPHATPSTAASAVAGAAHEATPSRRASHARFHVVKPGESLWSIAEELLGPDATDARIAREVDALWALNATRIGSGDPDVLPVGTKLELP